MKNDVNITPSYSGHTCCLPWAREFKFTSSHGEIGGLQSRCEGARRYEVHFKDNDLEPSLAEHENIHERRLFL